MSHKNRSTPHSIPLGGLGTGAVEVCSDGRFRNLTLNNNRILENRLPLAPHSFLAVRASNGNQHYVRRLQTPLEGADAAHLLPDGGITFRGQYPLADCRVEDPGAPVETVWSAFGPVVPYDYDASALPLAFFAVNVTNVSGARLEISALLNWQNTCGESALHGPEHPPRIVRETVVSQADWDRMKGGATPDNERRLSAKSGRIEHAMPRDFHPGEIPPNALVFGDAREVDGNEDGQYCIATPWDHGYQTSIAIWDPEDVSNAGRFWSEFSSYGDLRGLDGDSRPLAGAVCNRFALEAGASRTVFFVVGWYCPRYAVGGPDEGNFYANTYPDARAVVRVGLANSGYFYAAITTWHKRINSAGIPSEVVRSLLRGCEVLSTNSIHTRDGNFGLFESLHDPRTNHLRDRWFWSMGLLLFYPRLELEVLDRMSQRVMDPETRALRISEGIEGFHGAEFVAAGAAQVEAVAYLVSMAYRDFRFGGSLSALSRLAPRLQTVMAALLAQDKDVDGFPDILQEEPGLDGVSARSLNVITAGLWMVALRAYERVASRLRYPEADLYTRAFERAARSFDRYFWNRDHGYYLLYPDPKHELVPENDYAARCHIGQLIPIWMAGLLDLPGTFPRARIARLMETIETHNVTSDRIQLWSLPGGDPDMDRRGADSDWEVSTVRTYATIAYLGAKSGASPEFDSYGAYLSLRGGPNTPVSETGASGERWSGPRHLGQLSLWYLLFSESSFQLDLAEKRLFLDLDRQVPGSPRAYTLITPNGFGSATIDVNDTDAFRCDISFRMDIPQELARVELLLPVGVHEVRCRLEVEDGPFPVTCAVETGQGGGRAVLVPQGKLSTSSFALRISAAVPGEGSQSSRKQWIPNWFRK